MQRYRASTSMRRAARCGSQGGPHPLPSDDGIIDRALLDRAVTRRGDVHHSHPATSPTQSHRERPGFGAQADIADFVDHHAHELDLLVHVDGAQTANAIYVP